jgi:hypothetical protein
MDEDFFRATAQLASGGVSNAGRSRLTILATKWLYLMTLGSAEQLGTNPACIERHEEPLANDPAAAMKLFQSGAATLLAWAACCCCVYASPTLNEFLPCHKRAALTLQHCLDRQPGTANEECWLESRQVRDSCYDNVVSDHAPDKARAAAMRRAEEAARRASPKD